jgi:hypothetical protein
MSTTHCVKLIRLLVAVVLDADAERTICALFWSEIVTFADSVGDLRPSGVGAMDDAAVEEFALVPGAFNRCWSASWAASARDRAEGFFRAVLKENLGLGASAVRVD